MATDPVCGMTVSSESRFRHVHAGATYLFCGAHCLSKFQASPSEYAGKQQSTPKAETPPTGAAYACPMHPEAVENAPGNCPKCGMTLKRKNF